MTTQRNVGDLLKLLNLNVNNPIVTECINEFESGRTFIAVDENREGRIRTTKEQILSVYGIRHEMELGRKDNPWVFGFEELMPALRSTDSTHIGISSIDSETGSYAIFTTEDHSGLIGILKTKRILYDFHEDKGPKRSPESLVYFKGKLQL
jgi:hypothetical protein